MGFKRKGKIIRDKPMSSKTCQKKTADAKSIKIYFVFGCLVVESRTGRNALVRLKIQLGSPLVNIIVMVVMINCYDFFIMVNFKNKNKRFVYVNPIKGLQRLS